jgi:hypothetical protein
MAWRFAMRETPIAKVTVTTAGKPLGIALTASATAASKTLTAAWPCTRPTKKVSAAKVRIIFSKVRLNASNLRVSGVCRDPPSSISLEMRPVWVWLPMATTTPAPWPKVTKLPA